jgi:hypothetical protein
MSDWYRQVLRLYRNLEQSSPTTYGENMASPGTELDAGNHLTVQCSLRDRVNKILNP